MRYEFKEFGVMDTTMATVPQMKFIGNMDIYGLNPFEFIRIIVTHWPKPFEFIGKLDIHDPKPYEFTWKIVLHGAKSHELLRKMAILGPRLAEAVVLPPGSKPVC